MGSNLNIQKDSDWDKLIVVVSHLCSKWQNKEAIQIDGDSIFVHQKSNNPILGFCEGNKYLLTEEPQLTYSAILKLLQKLNAEKYLAKTRNIYLAIHDKELGTNDMDESYYVHFDSVYLCIRSSGITQECLAILKRNGEYSSQDNWHLYLQNLAQKSDLQNIHWELWGFIHDTDSKIFDCLCGENIYDCLLTEGLKKNLIKPFSILKHRIAHLFLPLDIDLQGICEVLSPEFSPPNGKPKEELAEEYYKEALQKSPKKIFEAKLKKAKGIVENTAPDEIKDQILDKLKNNGVEIWTAKPEGGDLETFITCAQESRNSFHSWFCELSEILKMPTSATS